MLRYVTLCYVTLHYIALRCLALHCITIQDLDPLIQGGTNDFCYHFLALPFIIVTSIYLTLSGYRKTALCISCNVHYTMAMRGSWLYGEDLQGNNSAPKQKVVPSAEVSSYSNNDWLIYIFNLFWRKSVLLNGNRDNAAGYFCMGWIPGPGVESGLSLGWKKYKALLE